MSFTSSFIPLQSSLKSAVRRIYLRVLTDVAKTVDYTVKFELKSVRDTAKAQEYIRRAVMKRLADDMKALDYIASKTYFIRRLVDGIEVFDYIATRTAFYRSAFDSFIGEHELKSVRARAIIDTLKAADYTCRKPLKVVRDTGRAGDYTRKTPLKLIVDQSKVADYTRKTPYKSILDTVKNIDWHTRTAKFNIPILDVCEAVDYACRLSFKRFIDTCRALDYTRTLTYKRLIDTCRAIDYTKKMSVKRLLDMSRAVEYVGKIAVKSILDSGETFDFIGWKAHYHKILVDSVEAFDYIATRTMFYKSILDGFIGEHEVKGVRVKAIADVMRVGDYTCKAALKPILETVGAVDYSRLEALKHLEEVCRATDYASKTSIKQLLDSANVTDWYTRTVKFIVGLMDVSVTYDYVRRMPSKHLHDVYLGADYTRIQTCKKLIDAIIGVDYTRRATAKRLLDECRGVDMSKIWMYKSLLDLAVGVDYTARYTCKALIDVAEAFDFTKPVASFVRSVADWLVGEHVVEKTPSLRLMDSTRTLDYTCRYIDKQFIEQISSVDYARKIPLKRLADSVKSLDWHAVFTGRMVTLTDFAKPYDYVRRTPVKSLVDWVVGEHIPVRGVGKRLIDEVYGVDYTCRAVVKRLVDEASIVDFSRIRVLKLLLDSARVHELRAVRELGKFLLDQLRALDYVERIRLKEIFEALKVNEMFAKDVAKRVLEALTPADYLRKTFEKSIIADAEAWDRYSKVTSYHVSLHEVVEAYDVMKKDILKVYRDYVVVRDAPYRRLILSFIDRLVDEGGVEKIPSIRLRDKAVLREIVSKVGFTVRDIYVRRAYTLPREFKALWDIIMAEDHNAKIDIAKALLNALKKVAEKLGE